MHSLNRRHFLEVTGLAGLSWLTPVSQLLARAAEKSREPAQSIILLWLAGGPSQLETFVDYGATSGVAAAMRVRDDGIQLNLVSELDEKLMTKSPTFFSELPKFEPGRDAPLDRHELGHDERETLRALGYAE